MKIKNEFRRVLSAAAAFVVAAGLLLSPAGSVKAEAAGAIATGIDVSHYQGAVNWQAVKNAGVSFAFIRVGTSKTADQQCAANLQGAAAAGLRTGVYFYTYATTPEQAAAEALNVVNTITPFQVSFPVAVDIEDEVHKNLSPDQLAAIANAFCSVVAQAGYYPMVYGSRNWFIDRIGSVFADKWIAQYNTTNTYPGAYGVWQYTSSGSVPGVSGRVDMNYLFTDYSSLIIPQGFLTTGGQTYYFRNYRKQFGWVNDNGGLYFCGADGAVQRGWFSDGTFLYYLNPAEAGKAAVGLQSVEGLPHLFNAAGAMLLGLQPVNDKLMYFDPAQNGAAVKGFVTLADGIRYFGSDYTMALGLTNIDGRLYYFGSNGIMHTGWLGEMPNRQFFGADGAMAAGLQTIDGAVYYFDPATGIMLTGLVTTEQGTRFMGADGRQVTGFVQIGAGYYYFDPATGVMVQNATVNIAGLDCTFDASGLLVAPAGLVPGLVSAVVQ